MAAGDYTLTNAGLLAFFDNSIDYQNDTLVMVLLDADAAPGKSSATYSDVSGNEIGDDDYAPQTITGASITQGSDGAVTITHNSVPFGESVSIEGKYAVLVRQSGSSLDSGDLVVAFIDLDTGGGTVASTNSEYTVSPGADGAFVVS